MREEYQVPKLNSFQAKNIMEHLKNNKRNDRKKDMDEVAQSIAEALMLNGYSNGESSYILLNVQRHILSLEKNKKLLEGLGVTEKDLNLDVLSFIAGVNAKAYRSEVDKYGKPK